MTNQGDSVMGNRRTIAVGQWLALRNKVSRMEQDRRGQWIMTDQTGATYEQRDFPHGLKTWDEPTDGNTEVLPTAWPPAEPVPPVPPEEDGPCQVPRDDGRLCDLGRHHDCHRGVFKLHNYDPGPAERPAGYEPKDFELGEDVTDQFERPAEGTEWRVVLREVLTQFNDESWEGVPDTKWAVGMPRELRIDIIRWASRMAGQREAAARQDGHDDGWAAGENAKEQPMVFSESDLKAAATVIYEGVIGFNNPHHASIIELGRALGKKPR